MTFAYHLDFLERLATHIRGFNNYSLLLVNAITTALNTNSSTYDLISQELLQENGYEPKPLTLGLGSRNLSSSSYDLPNNFVTFTAGALSLQYTHLLLWQGRTGVANRPIESANPNNDCLFMPGHALQNGTPVIVTSSDELPNGIPNQVLYVSVWDVNHIQICQSNLLNDPVSFSSAGTGQLTLRFAQGTPVRIWERGTTTIAAGQSDPILIQWGLASGS